MLAPSIRRVATRGANERVNVGLIGCGGRKITVPPSPTNAEPNVRQTRVMPVADHPRLRKQSATGQQRSGEFHRRGAAVPWRRDGRDAATCNDRRPARAASLPVRDGSDEMVTAGKRPGRISNCGPRRIGNRLKGPMILSVAHARRIGSSVRSVPAECGFQRKQAAPA